MPGYAVDSSKQPMIATGVVAMVQEWEERDGSRRPSDRQARDENTGFPLWNVEVLYQQASFGRVSSVTAMVTVGSLEQPQVTALSPVQFEGLRVDVRLTKAKQLVEVWTADGVVGPKPAARGVPGPADGRAA